MKLIFIRHAQSISDKLTRLGVKQAKNCIKELNYENIVDIYASPLNRTTQTAKIIGKKLKLNVTLDNRLREREMDVSHLDEQEQKICNANYLNPKFSHSNPEGCKEFCERVFNFLDDVLAKNYDDDQSVLIVGHSSLAYVMYAYFYGLPKDRNLVWVRVGNASKLAFQSIDKRVNNEKV